MKTWNDFLEKPIDARRPGRRAPSPTSSRGSTRTCSAPPIKLVAGYPGTNEITLAMERGEVDGLCGLSWSTIKTRHAQWLQATRRSTPGAGAFKKEPELGDVPLVMELTKDTEKLQILKLILVGAGDGAAVRGAARHSGRPQGRADRGLRRHHEGPGVSGRGQEAQHRRQSGQRQGSTLLAELYATPKDVVKKAGEALRSKPAAHLPQRVRCDDASHPRPPRRSSRDSRTRSSRA